MEREIITSKANPLLSRVRKLNSRRSFRREEGAFAAEGPKLLDEALRWGGPLEAVISAPGVPLPELPAHVRLAEVGDSLLNSIADTEHPQGIVFICKGKALTLPGRLAGGRYLVLDGVQDPGNVGTIWRTADAFGADGLILCSGCADPWNPKTVRATMGAVFRLPVYEGTLEEAAEKLSEEGIPLYAAALREDTADVRSVSLDRAAVIIGSEGRGVSPQALELCQKTVKIPMRARCESLNAAVAASVVLWEMSRND
ncbi:MAG: RNA methyltransferase [Oscillospiraceae bacterium]|nr:RNA methyltransferase [Oscillospiraceae bacterium]